MESDIIICDYNYLFDPNVALKRLFGMEQKQDYVFLIDEAHNLPERAREIYGWSRPMGTAPSSGRDPSEDRNGMTATP